MSSASDINETPKMDLGISGVCYMHTMLIHQMSKSGNFPHFDQLEEGNKHKVLICKLLITKVSTCGKLSRLP